MKPDIIQRFRFSSEEAIAALLPNIPPSQYREIRIDGEELLIELVNPKGSGDVLPEQQEQPKDAAPEGQPAPDLQEHGPLESMVLGLLEVPAFIKWGKCETREEAEKKLLGRFRVERLSDLDTDKASKHIIADVHDVAARFNAWMEGN